jgi:hypothetical protein
MFDQVAGSAELASKQGNVLLTALAWLHKSQEEKRISQGQTPLTDEQIPVLLTQAGCTSEQMSQIVEALQFLKTADNAEVAHKKTNIVNSNFIYLLVVL